jgi:predicted TIM-barrel fold metal-dependent hydrolase
VATGFWASPGKCALDSEPAGIIDTHVHFYDPTRPGGVPWPPAKDPLLYRPALPEHYATAAPDVAGVIVVEASPLYSDNHWVLDLAERNPLIVGLIGKLDFRAPEFGKQLDQLMGNPRFLGTRVSALEWGPHWERFVACDRILEVIARRDILPKVLQFCQRAPAQRIVLEHLPFDSSGGPEHRACLRELAQAPNVYAKLSNALQSGRQEPGRLDSLQAEALEEIWQLFGEQRLVFGSNWPVSDRVGTWVQQRDALHSFLSERSPTAARRFWGQNSRMLYRWSARTLRQEAIR